MWWKGRRGKGKWDAVEKSEEGIGIRGREGGRLKGNGMEKTEGRREVSQ